LSSLWGISINFLQLKVCPPSGGLARIMKKRL
jgi:hypothetical protein